jgi:hypothetical protein
MSGMVPGGLIMVPMEVASMPREMLQVRTGHRSTAKQSLRRDAPAPL